MLLTYKQQTNKQTNKLRKSKEVTDNNKDSSNTQCDNLVRYTEVRFQHCRFVSKGIIYMYIFNIQNTHMTVCIDIRQEEHHKPKLLSHADHKTTIRTIQGNLYQCKLMRTNWKFRIRRQSLLLHRRHNSSILFPTKSPHSLTKHTTL